MSLGQVDWVTIAVAAVVLVVAWVILRSVLRLTMRMFSIGCIALVLLGVALVALAYFRR
jgi:hypothetical protein